MSLWHRLKSMTSSNAAVDRGKAAYMWFEGQALRLSYPEGDPAAIEQYLENRWTELPVNYKDRIVPELFNVQEIYQQANNAQAAADSTKCMSLDAWQRATGEQIELYADSFATCDERLASLQKLLEVRKRCKNALSALVSVRNGKEALRYLSREDAVIVTKILNQADGQVAGAEQEIRELEGALPILRENEEQWRRSRREVGVPVGPGWLGSWYLGGGSYGKAYLWVRQDSQGRIVDVSVASLPPNTAADFCIAHRHERYSNRPEHGRRGRGVGVARRRVRAGRNPGPAGAGRQNGLGDGLAGTRLARIPRSGYVPDPSRLLFPRRPVRPALHRVQAARWLGRVRPDGSGAVPVVCFRVPGDRWRVDGISSFR